MSRLQQKNCRAKYIAAVFFRKNNNRSVVVRRDRAAFLVISHGTDGEVEHQDVKCIFVIGTVYYKVLSEVPDLLVDGCHNPFLLVVDFIIPTHEVALNVPVFEVNVEFGLEQGKFLLDHADFPTVFPNGLGR